MAEDLRVAIGTLVRAVRRESGTPTSAQSETLGLLDRNGAMNIATLAQTRNVTHQTMRMILTQLEAAGLVTRSADPQDRRSQIFGLSPAGQETLAQGRAARSASMAGIIEAQLSAAERKVLRQAVPLLLRIGTAHEG